MFFSNSNDYSLQQTQIDELEKRISRISKLLEKTKEVIDTMPTAESFASAIADISSLEISLVSLTSELGSLSSSQVTLTQIEDMLSTLETAILDSVAGQIETMTALIPTLVVSRWAET